MSLSHVESIVTHAPCCEPNAESMRDSYYTDSKKPPTSIASQNCSAIEEGSWRDKVRKKLAADKGKILEEWILDPELVAWAKRQPRLTGGVIESLLDNVTRDITNMDALELLDRMSRGNMTAFQVVSAFCKRSACIHQISPLFLELGFDLALKQARKHDDYFNEHKKLVGPLHGLPFTMKDQFHIEGMATTAGYVGWIDTFEGTQHSQKYMKFESELVKEMKSLGAIPIGKTTLATGTWSAVTSNNILGYAENPHNHKLSTGGSSGGEAAVQALRGSCFGFGTDIGGSVSMPASYQGLYSFKPSEGRISFQGGVKMGPGQLAMQAVVGIMGPSLSVLRLVFKSTLSTQPWNNDRSVLPIPWQGSFDGENPQRLASLTFGILENDGVVTPHPPISRAMRIVRKALQHSGAEILNWNPPIYHDLSQIHRTIARGDGCTDVWEALQLSGEAWTRELKRLFPTGRPEPPISSLEFADASARMADSRDAWNRYWELSSKNTKAGLPVHAVISPSTPHAGIDRYQYKYCGEKIEYLALLIGVALTVPNEGYSSSINVLDCPTITIPVTTADQELDKIDANFKPLSEEDEKVMDTYSPSVHHGAPINLQIIGTGRGEESLLNIAQLVVDALKLYRDESDGVLQ